MKSLINSRNSAILLALFVVFLWATSWVLIKIGLEAIPALTFAGLRYFLGFVFLLPIFFKTDGPASLRSLSRRNWSKLLLLGLLLFAVTQGSIFIALTYLPAVTTNLLWNFSSVAVGLLGIRLLKERPTLIQWAGIFLAMVGAIVYFYPASFPGKYQAGLIAAVIGIIANVGASILGRDINRSGDLRPLTVTVVSMGIGSTTLLIASGIFQEMPNIGLQGWAIIVWLAAMNTALAFTLWNFTLRSLSATESSVINGTMLIWIPILAIVFLGEHITTKEWIGLIAAGIGTLIVQMRNPKALIHFFSRKRS